MSELAWVDAHCHLQLEIGEARFSPDDADAQITRARDAGVEWMVCVGTGLETSRQALDLAARYPDVYATVAYYLRHRPDVDNYLRQQEQRAGQMRREIDARSDRAEFRERLLARARAKQVGV